MATRDAAGAGGMEAPGGGRGLSAPSSPAARGGSEPAAPGGEAEAEAEVEAAPEPEPEHAVLLEETPGCAVELPEGACACELAEPARQPPARGHCLLRNWQEERATNHLDQVPSPRGGTEGFFYRHGHHGLLTLQGLAGLAESTTMKDSYRRPWRTGLPVRGQREAMMEWLLYQKYSKVVFEEDVAPPRSPMESLSTTHQDYRQEGFLSVPPAPTQPHDYRTEQPRSFWLEHAQQVAGVSRIQSGDAPFKRCASFTTPVTERLDQPMPPGPQDDLKL